METQTADQARAILVAAGIPAATAARSGYTIGIDPTDEQHDAVHQVPNHDKGWDHREDY